MGLPITFQSLIGYLMLVISVVTAVGWLSLPETHSWECFIVEMLACSCNMGGCTVTLSKGHKCVTSYCQSSTRLPVRWQPRKETTVSPQGQDCILYSHESSPARTLLGSNSPKPEWPWLEALCFWVVSCLSVVLVYCIAQEHSDPMGNWIDFAG